MSDWSWMWSMLSSPNAPAWVQAIGSVLAIIAAFAIPTWQRRTALKDADTLRKREEGERLKRLVTGLRAELNATMEAVTGNLETVERTLVQIEKAERAGYPLKDAGPRQFDFTFTDATIYKAVAAELGHFPPTAIHQIVMFYSLIERVSQTLSIPSSLAESFNILKLNAPRTLMQGAMVIEILDQFEKSNFRHDAKLGVPLNRAREVAQQIGYPLEEVLVEHGRHGDPPD